MRHPSLQEQAVPMVVAVAGCPAQLPSCPRLGGLARQPVPTQARLMTAAFQRSGGLVCGNEVAGMVQAHWDQAVSTVARWIVSRRVLSFVWQSQTLLPLFQFERPAMLLRPGMREVLAELNGVLDDWELARWFAEPNGWLDDEAPADLLARRPAEVLAAARADRFITRG